MPLRIWKKNFKVDTYFSKIQKNIYYCPGSPNGPNRFMWLKIQWKIFVLLIIIYRFILNFLKLKASRKVFGNWILFVQKGKCKSHFIIFRLKTSWQNWRMCTCYPAPQHLILKQFLKLENKDIQGFLYTTPIEATSKMFYWPRIWCLLIRMTIPLCPQCANFTKTQFSMFQM